MSANATIGGVSGNNDLEKRSVAKKNLGGGGVLTSNRLIGFAPGGGRIFTARLTMIRSSCYDKVVFSLELLEWDRTFSGFGGSENSGR